jgi:hypothetical protein
MGWMGWAFCDFGTLIPRVGNIGWAWGVVKIGLITLVGF